MIESIALDDSKQGAMTLVNLSRLPAISSEIITFVMPRSSALGRSRGNTCVGLSEFFGRSF